MDRRQATRHVQPFVWLFVWLALLLSFPSVADARTEPLRQPNIVIITIDTLRLDRISFYGYSRPTSPHIDALLGSGISFSRARVPEPLTAPAMASMLTSLFPHEHGTTRNGLRMRPGLPSLAKILERRGYRTAAFVGNWTLKDQLSGLGEHFTDFKEVFTRKRWLGLLFSEATAVDLTRETLAWIESHLESSRRPFLVWVHYVEPHAPYRFHRDFATRLGIKNRSDATPSDRYDTEIAFVDQAVGDLISGFESLRRPIDPMILFASDHGESLGEHSYWGHGRHLYDVTLRIPLGISWAGHIDVRTIDAPASLLDVPPTILGLLGVGIPESFRGFDWSSVLAGHAELPLERATTPQAHKGAVQDPKSRNARRQGLLAVARIAADRKEIFRVKSKHRWVFDLSRDTDELSNLAASGKSEPSEDLSLWMRQVKDGLSAADELPAPSLDKESIEQLRALGYIDD